MVVFCILHRRMYCATPAGLERCCLPLCAVQSVSPSKRSILAGMAIACTWINRTFKGTGMRLTQQPHDRCRQRVYACSMTFLPSAVSAGRCRCVRVGSSD